MLDKVAIGLSSSLKSFEPQFQTKTHNASHRAFCYIRGLFKSEKNKANCTSIADSLGELDHQSLHHVLSESPWDHRAVLDELAKRVNQLYKDQEDVALLLDEVGFRKKGKYSACVGRQYLGCLGKEDNGQVAVVSALSSDTHYCPIDVELFMPEKWEEDSVRRSKAKIPAHVRHQTKPEMALRMIRSIKKKGIRFDYVNFDALYGSSFSVIKSLDEDNICFIGDIKDNIQISTEPICFTLPEKTVSTKGRKFKNKRADQPMVSVKKYMKTLKNEDFEFIAFRKGTKQNIEGYFHQKTVWNISQFHPCFF